MREAQQTASGMKRNIINHEVEAVEKEGRISKGKSVASCSLSLTSST
jgi:hypothetical protein